MKSYRSIQHILSLTRKAVYDYDMIKHDETIAVGVSGGKDSLALLAALKNLSVFHPNNFKIVAITLDTGLPGSDINIITDFCDLLEVPLIMEKVDIYNIVFNIRKEKNPCSLCANLRRGALNDAAIKNGIYKIALGHHFDDTIETFLMNLFNEGRASCFSPVTFLDRRGITVIRPFIYVEEEEIKRFIKNESITVMPKCCPADGYTDRQTMKDFISAQEHKSPGFKRRLFGALERGSISGFHTNENLKRTKTKGID